MLIPARSKTAEDCLSFLKMILSLVFEEGEGMILPQDGAGRLCRSSDDWSDRSCARALRLVVGLQVSFDRFCRSFVSSEKRDCSQDDC